MRPMDKGMIWGAWALMAALGSVSAWKISKTPKVEPAIIRLVNDLNVQGPSMPPPPPVPVWRNRWVETVARARCITPGGDCPPLVGIPEPPPPPPPPTPVYYLPTAAVEVKADLLGTTVTWTLRDAPKRSLEPWMILKPAKPEGFIIKRQCGNGKPETLANLGPEARSFADLSPEPNLTYRYWVLVTGKETVGGSSYPPRLETATKGLDSWAEAKSPSNVRIKLVGGDKSNAIVRVETYDRTQKKWNSKIVQAVPGREIGKSGWTLKGLRFDNFTLVADVTDDEGVERVLSTKD